MDVKNIDRVDAFVTKDGSEIRELLAHRNSCIRKQSLAEARLPAQATTTPHYHPLTEEIYFILEGTGRMELAGEQRDVGPGDAVAIPPGQVHQISNTGQSVLRFLCCCAGLRASRHGAGRFLLGAPRSSGRLPRMIHVGRNKVAQDVAGTAQPRPRHGNVLWLVERASSDRSSGSCCGCLFRPTVA